MIVRLAVPLRFEFVVFRLDLELLRFGIADGWQISIDVKAIMLIQEEISMERWKVAVAKKIKVF
jgi:hypothetical protein